MCSEPCPPLYGLDPVTRSYLFSGQNELRQIVASDRAVARGRPRYKFELEKDGQDYLVRSDSLSETSEWILRNAVGESNFTQPSSRRSTINRPLRFTPYNISRLDSHDQKQRKGILRHKRRAPGSCLNSCVVWAITLTERRSAGFAFSGTLMPFSSITRNPTGGATVEHLPLINCSSWACTQDFDALREVRERPSGSHHKKKLMV